MLTQSSITRIVNPTVTVHFIMDTVLPGHAVSIFRCCGQMVGWVVYSYDHTPEVAELLPRLHQDLNLPIPWADNCAGEEPQTRAAGFEQAFSHSVDIRALHCTASVAQPGRAGASR